MMQTVTASQWMMLQAQWAMSMTRSAESQPLTGNDFAISDTYTPIDEQAFLLGKVTGDVISIIAGAVGIINEAATIGESIVITGGGVVVTSTGALAPVGAAVTVVSVAGVAVGVAEVGAGIALITGGFGNLSEDIQNYNNSKNAWHKMTTKEADAAAKELGFQKTNYRSHGQPVYKKGNKYITPDTDGHNGGVWKMADSVENLGSKSTRMGTYDKNLNRIGD